MEQILSKLSEIELAAKAVQEEADKTRKVLSEEMEKQSKDFDAELERKTNARIQQIRDGLEKEKDAQLTALRHDTEAHFAALDTYYAANHERLSEDLFRQILQR
ncbi:MAG: hypothetical protein SOY73_05475 [Blautia sp.]|nr:hypothetical protein [Blautia sp.]MDY3998536.1 hypothetical protein [Blautia sp.]